MDKIAFASDIERKSIFIEAADKLNISESIVEKDFWVSWVLEKIFENNELSQILCFKGGTSLSKAFNLIDRFSEDIDLILSESIVLNKNETLIQSSKTKQVEFIKIIEERALEYIRTNLFKKITGVLGSTCFVYPDNEDGHSLYIKFPHVFNYSYIQQEIKLEIGPLALWNPNNRYSISSFLTKALPELKLIEPVVPIIKPERTFWEKITILHHEHHRPVTSPLQPRYSRHYYDVYKMGNNEVKNIALANTELLIEVVNFKKRFYPRGWANYDAALPGTICILPAKYNIQSLAEDYIKMQKMLFGEIPQWDTILSNLQKLEIEINKIGI
ncbi:MAG: nucleotidyl transferase AbiEii/AbiGii toxin family protein [Treponema sp.]|nr:nucleotidyl transferase AbiEii/AbiGii toxin family protein [Treponema sp.]